MTKRAKVPVTLSTIKSWGDPPTIDIGRGDYTDITPPQ
jgi:hypothetical protein